MKDTVSQHGDQFIPIITAAVKEAIDMVQKTASTPADAVVDWKMVEERLKVPCCETQS
jgi:hypothetical protein